MDAKYVYLFLACDSPANAVNKFFSVWVPFTSESKEAIAHYPEIIKEVKLALQEVGRKLSSYVYKKKKIQAESKKRDYIQTYIHYKQVFFRAA